MMELVVNGDKGAGTCLFTATAEEVTATAAAAAAAIDPPVNDKSSLGECPVGR